MGGNREQTEAVSVIAESARAIANGIGVSQNWPVTLDTESLGRSVESLALLVAQLADAVKHG